MSAAVIIGHVVKAMKIATRTRRKCKVRINVGYSLQVVRVEGSEIDVNLVLLQQDRSREVQGTRSLSGNAAEAHCRMFPKPVI
jgi:hypothetical protein